MSHILFRYTEKSKRFDPRHDFPHTVSGIGQNTGMPKIDIAQVFTSSVLRWRELRGMNQSDLARKSGVSNAHLSEVMHGQSSITIDLVADIAEALGVEPWELLLESEFAKRIALAKMVWSDTKGTNERVEQFFPPAPKMEAAPPPRKKRGRKRRDPGNGQNEPRNSP
jgi:transcriptional regulator with XRE-family HTH domain